MLNITRFHLIAFVFSLVSGCATTAIEGLKVTNEFYENYCGGNYPKVKGVKEIVNSNSAPKDDIDKACLRHDICYDKKVFAYFNQYCDDALFSDLNIMQFLPKVNDKCSDVRKKLIECMGLLPIKTREGGFTVSLVKLATVVPEAVFRGCIFSQKMSEVCNNTNRDNNLITQPKQIAISMLSATQEAKSYEKKNKNLPLPDLVAKCVRESSIVQYITIKKNQGKTKDNVISELNDAKPYFDLNSEEKDQISNLVDVVYENVRILNQDYKDIFKEENAIAPSFYIVGAYKYKACVLERNFKKLSETPDLRKALSYCQLIGVHSTTKPITRCVSRFIVEHKNAL